MPRNHASRFQVAGLMARSRGLWLDLTRRGPTLSFSLGDQLATRPGAPGSEVPPRQGGASPNPGKFRRGPSWAELSLEDSYSGMLAISNHDRAELWGHQTLLANHQSVTVLRQQPAAMREAFFRIRYKMREAFFERPSSIILENDKCRAVTNSPARSHQALKVVCLQRGTKR
jgi:hypothetical protein